MGDECHGLLSALWVPQLGVAGRGVWAVSAAVGGPAQPAQGAGTEGAWTLNCAECHEEIGTDELFVEAPNCVHVRCVAAIPDRVHG